MPTTGGASTNPASETVAGIAELATQTETNTGTDDARIVTPAKLAGRTATATQAGVVELATDTEAQTGTDTARAITPANLTARSSTESRAGIAELATQAETDTGTDDTRIVTPSKLANHKGVKHLQEVASGTIRLGSPLQYAMLTGKSNAYVCSNAYWDDVNSWQRYDTAASAALIVPDRSGVLSFFTAPAGANPITWTTRQVMHDGNIATQIQADAGTDDATILTPLKARNRPQTADLFSDFVVSGFNPSLPGATLTMTTPTGVAYIGGLRVSIAADTSRAYTASRDTYLDVNASGTYTAVAVTNGAAEPALTANSVRILKVVTNASQVTAITQRNQYTDFRKKYAYGACAATWSGTVGTADGVARKVGLNTVTYDNDGRFSTTNTRYDVGRTGLYFVTLYGQSGAATAVSNFVQTFLYKNGSSVATAPICMSGGLGLGMSSGTTVPIYAASGDYLELWEAHSNNGTGTLNFTTASMSVVWYGGMKNVPGP